ncbi:MAG TPA: NAD-dependent epimerase/dehydratase family protein [Thermoanaerobaculia bacterium]|nr:NAD-dependent epimerase/dehydratase family protein [Thermoanaerobaculia bacterium]
MRLFVTGATGYIGTALVRRLAADGHEVRALVRATSRTDVLRELGVTTFVGDVSDPGTKRSSLREAMSGADWVLHLAAELDPHASLERMRRVNVEGSEAVASLASKLGVGRFLSVSSVAYFGGSPEDGAPATEETPPREPFPSAYSLTKHEAERAIRAWAGRGLSVHTVYPSLVYGPPGKKQGANWLLRAILKERFPVLVGGDRTTSWVFLDDVVEAIVRLMDRSPSLPPGRDYLLAGDRATVRELARRVAELGGVRAPRRDLPLGLARFATAATAPLFRLAGTRPPLPPEQLRSLARHWSFDDARARRELDWRPRTLAEGLPPTVEYIQAAG